jgi:hypothetical protein
MELNACDSAPDLYSGTAQNTRTRAVKELVLLVEKLVAEEPYLYAGLPWAARSRKFYAEAIGVSLDTIGRYSAKPPFVKKVKSVQEGGTITLLRTGEAPPCLADDYAKRVMIKFWRQQQDKTDTDGKFLVSQHGGRCLWGFAKDIRLNIGDKRGFPPEWSAQLAIETFKHAVFNWPFTAGLLKIAAQTVTGYKPPFLDFVSLPHLAHLSEAAVHAYVMHVQETKKTTKALACLLADPMVSPAILNLTDPWQGHPGSTPEIEKAYDAGWAVAEAKALWGIAVS